MNKWSINWTYESSFEIELERAFLQFYFISGVGRELAVIINHVTPLRFIKTRFMNLNRKTLREIIAKNSFELQCKRESSSQNLTFIKCSRVEKDQDPIRCGYRNKRELIVHLIFRQFASSLRVLCSETFHFQYSDFGALTTIDFIFLIQIYLVEIRCERKWKQFFDVAVEFAYSLLRCILRWSQVWDVDLRKKVTSWPAHRATTHL